MYCNNVSFRNHSTTGAWDRAMVVFGGHHHHGLMGMMGICKLLHGKLTRSFCDAPSRRPQGLVFGSTGSHMK
jgi:hypothetical protein